MLPVLLLAGCAATSPTTSPPIVRPPMLAPLPDSARQTPAPSICLPSCSAALMSERESWRALLMMSGKEAVSASAPTRLVCH
ncbi:hypothetical protein FB549_4071 [Delftia sp. HK171]|nr:hypothetical protein FB549_4071 [Delftia sp. HK171]